MVRAAFLASALSLAAASGCFAADKSSFFCTAEISRGLFYNNTAKAWAPTIFKAEQKFVLSLEFMSESVDAGVPKTIYRVTLTPSGANFPAICTKNGQVDGNVT